MKVLVSNWALEEVFNFLEKLPAGRITNDGVNVWLYYDAKSG